MQTLKALVDAGDFVVAPVALNPVMARLAEDAGFKAVYLSGGSLGWLKCVTEANLSLSDMVQVAVDIRSVSRIPIVLDAGGGWGEPVHIHRTIAMSEAAGFAAIEIEDQYLPRRVQHHIGEENLIPPESMVDKIKEAVAARTDPNLIVIGRTNARRLHGLDEALRRGEMYHCAGADMLFIHSRDPEELRRIAERLPAPLMMFAPQDGFSSFGITPAELTKLGYRLAASSGTAFAAMYKAVRQSYEALARGEVDPLLGKGGAVAEMKRAHDTTGLQKLLDIEKRTTKRVG
ncbi:MAG TPA: isocitrate lyase/PEP mutase family protein [Pseudolabrys sp.]|uniref:isocitrate lyase/PEP mutase family protein n=1 Tax=Pseudolabrys sp. TaxID=1960880 RepID=UPI002DDD3A07|nr:isocitrate lyase/PEP mutase family protein [Pseudolabrys sp.]HEV2629119.1 isocitrate lyase/PEP mutase family protein [Pseudolabrys sp.]